MKNGMQVGPSALSGHAAKMTEINTSVGGSTFALASTSLTGQTFSDLCSFLVSSLELAEKEVDAVTTTSAAAIDVTVSDLCMTANFYETADSESTRDFRKLGEILGGTNAQKGK